jgi:hypothetical protein
MPDKGCHLGLLRDYRSVAALMHGDMLLDHTARDIVNSVTCRDVRSTSQAGFFSENLRGWPAQLDPPRTAIELPRPWAR